MVILKTDTLALLLQKDKFHLIIAVVNRLDNTQILFFYYRLIELSAVIVGMTFIIVPTAANTKQTTYSTSDLHFRWLFSLNNIYFRQYTFINIKKLVQIRYFIFMRSIFWK